MTQRKQKWGARILIVGAGTSILGAAFYGLWLIPVSGFNRYHHPLHVWPVSSYHFLAPIVMIFVWIAVGVALIFILGWICFEGVPKLFRVAEW